MIDQIDFKIKCSIVHHKEISEDQIEEIIEELESLLKENGFKKVTVNIV